MQWFGPKGFTITTANMDLRPGGTLLFSMRSPDGKEMWGKFVYREIIPPERIVWVNSFSDKDGGLTRHPMTPSWPMEMLSSVTFTEQAGKTTVTIQWSPLNASAEELQTFENMRSGMNQGWGGTLEQLGKLFGQRQVIKGAPHAHKIKTAPEKNASQELVITRTFQAPREVVFKAWTDPRHIAQCGGD